MKAGGRTVNTQLFSHLPLPNVNFGYSQMSRCGRNPHHRAPFRKSETPWREHFNECVIVDTGISETRTIASSDVTATGN